MKPTTPLWPKSLSVRALAINANPRWPLPACSGYTVQAMTPPAPNPSPPMDLSDIPVPDVSQLVTEDDTPVDNLFSEKQRRLFTEPLYSSWAGPGEGRPFLAAANVGVFVTAHDPPMVPDVLVAVDTASKSPLSEKKNRSYFVWKHGKPPDVVIEMVSNAEGEELSKRLRNYERMRVPHYAVFDPFRFLSDVVLRRFELHGGAYVEAKGAYFDSVGLGVVLWEGVFEGETATWLRWHDAQGHLIPTGRERAESAEERAETAEKLAERLAQRLRELGIDPDR
jgi:hypothetical protein